MWWEVLSDYQRWVFVECWVSTELCEVWNEKHREEADLYLTSNCALNLLNVIWLELKLEEIRRRWSLFWRRRSLKSKRGNMRAKDLLSDDYIEDCEGVRSFLLTNGLFFHLLKTQRVASWGLFGATPLVWPLSSSLVTQPAFLLLRYFVLNSSNSEYVLVRSLERASPSIGQMKQAKKRKLGELHRGAGRSLS